MKILIQSPGVQARQELLDFIQEKVEKLERFTDRIVEARVLLKTDSSSTQENKIVEVTVVIPGNDLFVKRNADAFEKATLEIVEVLSRQLKEWKHKVQSR